MVVWVERFSAMSVLLAISASLGAGCAMIQGLEAIETERMLTAAGFHMRPADTVERQEDLRSMRPHTIVRRTENGNAVYMYADPDTCHCVYVGTNTEYSEYERLRVTKEVARRMRGSSPSGGALGGAP